MNESLTIKQRIQLFVFPLTLRILMRILSFLVRLEVRSDSGPTALPDYVYPVGRVYAFWHGMLLFATFPFRHKGVHAVVSLSRDGEYLSRVLSAWGYRMIRGSSSRGGLQVYRKALEVLRSGGTLGLAPDGPRGPRQQVNPGAVRMAATSGAHIIPMGCAYSKKITFRSWDRFQIPLPFSKVAVIFGEPIGIFGNDDVACRAVEEELRLRMNDLTLRAEQLVGLVSK